jgi:hypothetical protein
VNKGVNVRDKWKEKYELMKINQEKEMKMKKRQKW